MRKLFLMVVVLFFGSLSTLQAQTVNPETLPGSGKVFIYTAKKLGIPILKASIKIENGFFEQRKPCYQVHADIESLQSLGLFFRMKNRFTSTMETDTCLPVQYVKEINQEGLLIGNKNYLQTFLFDYPNKKVIMERKDRKEKQEISIPIGTFDPLSMFARYYLREELPSGQEIRMSIYDGIRLRQMVFQSKKEKVASKIYGEIETVCLESTTSFSTFDDREGTIRIWYTTNGEKTPIRIELELPVGTIKFELESIQRS